MILVLLIIWVLWIKIVVGFYPLVMPFFITQSIPALIRPYLLPSITTLFVFINFGITSLVYKKIPKIIYLLLPITIYLETIILATAIYYLIKF